LRTELTTTAVLLVIQQGLRVTKREIAKQGRLAGPRIPEDHDAIGITEHLRDNHRLARDMRGVTRDKSETI